jgi:hypothetical protein
MNNLITIILSALVGSGITYWFGVRHLRTETEIKVKVEKYNNLIKYLRGFIGVSASGELKKQFFQEWEASWLYCSDNVFNAVRRMIEYAQNKGTIKRGNETEDEVGKEMLGGIILAMRKDLLRKRTKLSNKDFIFWDIIE